MLLFSFTLCVYFSLVKTLSPCLFSGKWVLLSYKLLVKPILDSFWLGTHVIVY
jgi:hypothetical protein